MINPDGVVAGNYRTSLFGKDLNRTFHQSRKYAFPETYGLYQYAKKLKKQHKQRFTMYLDLHGHSTKKNIFFYGPDYKISDNLYNKSRQFAKILASLTSMFRYYSCIFRISNEKSTTARATFNRHIDIPFTYTLESSNGAFYDSGMHSEKAFLAKHWLEMGAVLVKGLIIWARSENSSMPRLNRSSSFAQDNASQLAQEIFDKQPQQRQHNSDDQISQGKSDSEPEDQDFTQEQLLELERQIQAKFDNESESPSKELKAGDSPKKQHIKNKYTSHLDWSDNLRQSHPVTSHKNSFSYSKKERLPPLNLQVNPTQFVSPTTNKRKISIIEALKNLTTTSRDQIGVNSQKIKRLSVSQMLAGSQSLSLDEQRLVLEKNLSRPYILQKSKFKR